MSSSVASAAELATSGNPLRRDVLAWYRKMLKAAFTVRWTSDEDAAYVLNETRRLFRVNQLIRDVSVIERKVLEAEQRYELAVHYRIPYPRMFHKAIGSSPLATAAYASYLDSVYEDGPVNPRVGPIEVGSSNFHSLAGSGGSVLRPSSTFEEDLRSS